MISIPPTANVKPSSQSYKITRSNTQVLHPGKSSTIAQHMAHKQQQQSATTRNVPRAGNISPASSQGSYSAASDIFEKAKARANFWQSAYAKPKGVTTQ